MPQSEKAQAPEKVVSLYICANCFTRQPPPEDLRVFKNCYGQAVSDDKFIDHQRAEQVMVLNDTIALRVSLCVRHVLKESAKGKVARLTWPLVVSYDYM